MPFDLDQFLAVFVAYNQAIWPLQVVTYLVGLAICALLFRPSRWADASILSLLATMWGVNAVGYHMIYFAAINPAARLFGAIFLVEVLLLVVWAFREREEPIFHPRRGIATGAGVVMIGYALVGYPLLGALMGHRYPAVPVFGVAPCPTTIFTIGVLVLGQWRSTRWLLIIPVLWSALGGSAAILLNVPQDFGLIAAGLAVILIAMARRRQSNLIAG
ncbi:DUF6064 family protein [Frigidibacter sp.]|uniref:DUF6064 family protein n=1 Tax=Frigidibacter sp. TaxID=2586418 RepID=UPI002734F3D5|nr:DUF6064 family protein [Frigidibacter sp.]MDP3339235.1 DUF6064 family protein [Frigidibacter sp.]